MAYMKNKRDEHLKMSAFIGSDGTNLLLIPRRKYSMGTEI